MYAISATLIGLKPTVLHGQILRSATDGPYDMGSNPSSSRLLFSTSFFRFFFCFSDGDLVLKEKKLSPEQWTFLKSMKTSENKDLRRNYWVIIISPLRRVFFVINSS